MLLYNDIYINDFISDNKLIWYQESDLLFRFGNLIPEIVNFFNIDTVSIAKKIIS